MSLLPKIIQGGMGAGVSSWRLARAVSALGQLGVVSGTALDVIIARRMQDGDKDGSVRHALSHFPFRDVAERFIERYFVRDGKAGDRPYRATPMPSVVDRRPLEELCMLGNFVEVFLAREGHDGPVGINFLEKIQLPLLPSMYGAMLAGVAFVMVGAGIPLRVPGVLDKLAVHQAVSYEIPVAGSESTAVAFDPAAFADTASLPPMERPRFVAMVSSSTLASTILRRADGRVDGFVVETSTAGGHNAPPRGKPSRDASGQPVYGEKDQVDLEKIRELGLPFWVAGGYASPERLREALDVGASGVQVGTAFALCEESGLAPAYRAGLLRKAVDGSAAVFTDPSASPTGFPFKVAQLEDTLSDRSVYESRPRVCDLGYLRHAYRTADGTIGFRCPAESVDTFVTKGGASEETVGRKCLCNALLANIGLSQRGAKRFEAPLLTAGDDLPGVRRFLRRGETTYTARDVIDGILGTPSSES
jgi:nitronate monooxygenase